MTKNCKVCEKVLGETCCTNDNGGLFCSVKCADIDEGKTKEQLKVHLIDGKRYGEVERRAKVGDNIVITKLVNGGEASFTIGNIYKVISDEYDSFLDVIDDDGDLAGILHDEYRVLEPIDQSPQSIEDIIANLTRRLAKVETELASVKNIANKALTATGNHGEWLIRNQERLVALESDEPIFTTKQVAEIIKALGVGAHD